VCQTCGAGIPAFVLFVSFVVIFVSFVVIFVSFVVIPVGWGQIDPAGKVRCCTSWFLQLAD
jgi:hypothetical protein